MHEMVMACSMHVYTRFEMACTELDPAAPLNWHPFQCEWTPTLPDHHGPFSLPLHSSSVYSADSEHLRNHCTPLVWSPCFLSNFSRTTPPKTCSRGRTLHWLFSHGLSWAAFIAFTSVRSHVFRAPSWPLLPCGMRRTTMFGTGDSSSGKLRRCTRNMV